MARLLEESFDQIRQASDFLGDKSKDRIEKETVIHNFYLKRPDGTTAAKRFFESKPTNMFEWLLEKMNFATKAKK